MVHTFGRFLETYFVVEKVRGGEREGEEGP